MVDCEAIKSDFADVAEMEQRELASAGSWLQATHKDIMTNFDPKVVKLKKKRKIVIAPGVLDGLEGEHNNE